MKWGIFDFLQYILVQIWYVLLFNLIDRIWKILGRKEHSFTEVLRKDRGDRKNSKSSRKITLKIKIVLAFFHSFIFVFHQPTYQWPASVAKRSALQQNYWNKNLVLLFHFWNNLRTNFTVSKHALTGAKDTNFYVARCVSAV